MGPNLHHQRLPIPASSRATCNNLLPFPIQPQSQIGQIDRPPDEKLARHDHFPQRTDRSVLLHANGGTILPRTTTATTTTSASKQPQTFLDISGKFVNACSDPEAAHRSSVFADATRQHAGQFGSVGSRQCRDGSSDSGRPCTDGSRTEATVGE